MKFSFERKNNNKESSIKYIPIINSDQKLYSLAEDPELEKENIIYKMNIRSIFFGDEKTFGYFLRHDISEHKYFFRLVKDSENDYYGFAFKTKNYEYSKTQLDQNENNDLLETIANFIESVHKDSGMDKIYLSPHSSDYSVEEVDQCVDILLKLPQYKDYSKEQILKEFPGVQIFDEFHYLFPDSSKFEFNNTKALVRKRWFEINFKKYLKNWNTKNIEGLKADFFLIRNK